MPLEFVGLVLVIEETVGAVTSHVTVLSVDVDAVLLLPAGSVTRFAAIAAITVPFVVMPLTARLNVLLSALGFVIVIVFVPPAVPVIATSDDVKLDVLIGSLKSA